MRFRAGNRHGAGSTPGGYSETTRPLAGDAAGELGVRARIVAVDPAAEDGDGQPAARRARPRCASPSMPRASPLTTTTPGGRQLPRELARDLGAVRRAAARADDATDGRARISAGPPRRCSRARRIVELGQERRIAAPAPRDDGIASRRRAPAASGRRAPRRRAAASIASAPASAAIVAATRATRARPRPRAGSVSTARERAAPRASPPSRGARLAQTRAQPRSTRSRTAAERLARARVELPPARPRHVHDQVEAVEERPRELHAVGGQPLRRAGALDRRVAARAAGAEVHRPDEHEARRKDRLARRPARPRRRRPRAAGAAPRAPAGGTPGSSSRSRTPWWARLTSPGRGPGPPPDDRGRRRRVVRRPEGRAVDERVRRREDARRPSGSGSPRAPGRASAAGGSRAAGAPASSSPCRAGRRAGRCGARRRRSRGPAAPAPARARRRGPGRSRSSATRRRLDGARLEARPGGRRRPRRGGGAAPARSPASAASGADSCGQSRRVSPARRAASAATIAPGNRPKAPVERELADGGVLGEATRAGSGARRRARPARSAGRSRSPPCAARPARG